MRIGLEVNRSRDTQLIMARRALEILERAGAEVCLEPALAAALGRRAGCAQAGRCQRLWPADGAGLQAGGSRSGAGSH